MWGGWHTEVFVTIFNVRWLSQSTWGGCHNFQYEVVGTKRSLSQSKWGGCHNFQHEVVVTIYSMKWLSQWGGCHWEFEVVVTIYNVRWLSQTTWGGRHSLWEYEMVVTVYEMWDGCHKLHEESILGKSPLLRSSGQGVWSYDHVTILMIHTHSGGARMVTQPLRRATSWGSCSWPEGGLAVG